MMDMEDVRRMFEEQQAKLPPEDRAATQGEEVCGELYKFTKIKCTRPKHEDGPHVACGMIGTVLLRWEK